MSNKSTIAASWLRSCNNCKNCLKPGLYVSCGTVMADSEEDEADLAEGIHHTFAEECADYQPDT